MEKLIQSKKYFIAKLNNVHLSSNYDNTGFSSEIVNNSLGFRLIKQIGKSTYEDVLTGNKVYLTKNAPMVEGALVVGDFKRPLYRYSRSLRVLEKESLYTEVAKYVEENYNGRVFNGLDHSKFYSINDAVKQNHNKEDEIVLSTSKQDLAKRLFGSNDTYDVDQIFVVKTNMIVSMEKTVGNEILSSNERPYDFILAIRKWNGKFEDVLTGAEITYFNENTKAGDIIVDYVRPLYRYAKSLRLHETAEDVKVYAKFVKERFNRPAYINDHVKFNEINEVVRACHNKENSNENTNI